MIQKLKLGGEERPIYFGWGALYLYEKETGRNPLEDFAKLVASPSVVGIVDIAYYGIVNGYQESGKDTPLFSPLNVANWLTETQRENPAIIEQVMQLFAAAMPQDDGEASDAKKKKVVRSTGLH